MCLPTTPYKIEREWTHAGLQCAATMAFRDSYRCGYVRVPPGHPMFGKSDDEVWLDVHGAITFAEIEPCSDHADGQGWWFGFDCATKGLSFEETVTEVERFAEQLAARAIMRTMLPSLTSG